MKTQQSMKLERVYQAIDQSFDEHVGALLRYIRQPSISALKVGIAEMASLVAQSLRDLGASAEICRTTGHPIVYGELDVGAPHTLLIYGMYDVQPADEPDWVVPPFEGGVREMPDLGRCIVGRGATNSKGPLIGTFNVVRAIQAAGQELPLNLIFMIEGEEELGSPSLPAFVLGDHRQRLERASAAYFPAFRQDRQDKVMIQLGTKGLLDFELICTGGAWGGPQEQGIHGADASWIGNPAWRLVSALASMMNAEEEIQIKDFYAEALGPTAVEEARLVQLAKTFDREGVLKESVVARYKYSGSDVDLLRHYLYDPTLNIDGIVGGYTDMGIKTLLPHKATAKMDVRMVPDMDGGTILDRLHAHLERHGYGDMEIRVQSCYPWSRMELEAPVVQAHLSSCRAQGADVEIWARNVGTAPFYLFKETLGIPYVMGGMGHGERAHSSNELCTVDGYRRFERCVATFFDHYSRLANGPQGGPTV